MKVAVRREYFLLKFTVPLSEKRSGLMVLSSAVKVPEAVHSPIVKGAIPKRS